MKRIFGATAILTLIAASAGVAQPIQRGQSCGRACLETMGFSMPYHSKTGWENQAEQ